MNKAFYRLAQAECANYGDGACLLLDKPCLLAGGEPCSYFEESVLPLDSGLESAYRLELAATATGEELTRRQIRQAMESAAEAYMRTCPRCGKAFPSKSVRQRFCDTCKKAVRREQARHSMKKRRQGVDVNTLTPSKPA